MNTISDKMTNPIPVRDLGVDLNHPDLLDTNTRNEKVNLLLQGIRETQILFARMHYVHQFLVGLVRMVKPQRQH